MNIEDNAYAALMVFLRIKAEQLTMVTKRYLPDNSTDINYSLVDVPKYTEQISIILRDMWDELQSTSKYLYCLCPEFEHDLIMQYENNNIFNACVENNALYVLMPRPGKRKVGKHTTPYVQALRDYLYFKASGSDFQLNTIQIRFLHVFPKGTTPYYTVDHDNYDTKELIDLACDLANCSDCGLNCSVLNESIISDEIPAVSYIIAEPLQEQYCSKSEVVNRLKQALKLS